MTETSIAVGMPEERPVVDAQRLEREPDHRVPDEEDQERGRRAASGSRTGGRSTAA